jgi:hypothetical protein
VVVVVVVMVVVAAVVAMESLKEINCYCDMALTKLFG